MSDLGDIDLDKQPDEASRDARRIGGWIAGALAVLLAGGAAFYYTRPPADPASEPQTQTAAPVERADSTPLAPVLDGPPLPDLGASDTLARELVGALSSRPELTTWLLTDGVIQSLTVMVDRVARGQVPTRELGIVTPVDPFPIAGAPDEATLGPASYARYDAFADLVESVDIDGSAQAYARLRPLFIEAYRNLGHPGAEFDDALEQAIAQILGAPVIDGDIRLVPKGALFAYADDRLESASPVQRQLLRMGPRNTRLIQDKAREFSAAIRPSP